VSQATALLKISDSPQKERNAGSAWGLKKSWVRAAARRKNPGYGKG